MRAIDFWVILCYTGMFSALMEYIVILYLSTVSQTDTEEGSQKRIMVANAIERVIKYVLPLYNLMFPIIFFTICPSQGGSNWLLWNEAKCIRLPVYLNVSLNKTFIKLFFRIKYSGVFNRRAGGNKHEGWKFV